MFTLIGSLILIFKELRFRKSEVMNLTEENSFCQIGFFSKLKKDQEGAAGKATLSSIAKTPASFETGVLEW